VGSDVISILVSRVLLSIDLEQEQEQRVDIGARVRMK
jgi:hypothetical protein